MAVVPTKLQHAYLAGPQLGMSQQVLKRSLPGEPRPLPPLPRGPSGNAAGSSLAAACRGAIRAFVSDSASTQVSQGKAWLLAAFERMPHAIDTVVGNTSVWGLRSGSGYEQESRHNGPGT